MARTMTSEVKRYNVSWMVALVAAFAVYFYLHVARNAFSGVVGTSTFIPAMSMVFYLLFWVSFVGIFLVWMVVTLGKATPEELCAYAVNERASAENRWVRWFAVKGATNLSSAAAVVAMVTAIGLTQLDLFRGNLGWMTLGGVAVALSWVYMIYTYASEYLEIDYARRARGEQPHFAFDFPEAPRFNDYLTLAIMTSTMSATVPAQPKSRLAWRSLRLNTIVAFVFNTMIIAMVVSVLSTTLTA